MADEVEVVELADELTRLGVAKTVDVATAVQGGKADSAIQPSALDAAIATRATAAQGVKADTAVQPSALDAAIATRATSAQGAKADSAVQQATLDAAIATRATTTQGAKADSAIQQAALDAAIATRASAAQGVKADEAVPASGLAGLVRLVTLGTLTLTNAAIAVGETYDVMFGKLQAQINAVITSLGNKVDKVGGKGLSTNDYDAAAASVVASVAGIGTNATKGIKAKVEVALSDEATALTTGTKLTVHVAEAMTLTEVFGGLSTVQAAGALLAFDVKKNGTSIFTTKPTIDNTEETTLTAAAPAVLNGTVTLAKGDKLTFSIDAVGDGSAKGLKVYLLGTR